MTEIKIIQKLKYCWFVSLLSFNSVFASDFSASGYAAGLYTTRNIECEGRACITEKTFLYGALFNNNFGDDVSVGLLLQNSKNNLIPDVDRVSIVFRFDDVDFELGRVLNPIGLYSNQRFNPSSKVGSGQPNSYFINQFFDLFVFSDYGGKFIFDWDEANTHFIIGGAKGVENEELEKAFEENTMGSPIPPTPPIGDTQTAFDATPSQTPIRDALNGTLFVELSPPRIIIRSEPTTPPVQSPSKNIHSYIHAETKLNDTTRNVLQLNFTQLKNDDLFTVVQGIETYITPKWSASYEAFFFIQPELLTQSYSFLSQYDITNSVQLHFNWNWFKPFKNDTAIDYSIGVSKIFFDNWVGKATYQTIDSIDPNFSGNRFLIGLSYTFLGI